MQSQNEDKKWESNILDAFYQKLHIIFQLLCITEPKASKDNVFTRQIDVAFGFPQKGNEILHQVLQNQQQQMTQMFRFSGWFIEENYCNGIDKWPRWLFTWPAGLQLSDWVFFFTYKAKLYFCIWSWREK